MKTLVLYRGLSVSEVETEAIMEDIKINGLYQTEKQQWGGFIWKNLKSNLDILYEKEDLSRKETSPESIWIERKNGGHREYTAGEHSICFADKIGAEFYATKHNITKEHNVPLLITAELEIDNIAIDGRDFLYTVFGFIDPKDIAKTKRQTEILKRIFGDKIEKYVKKLVNHPKSEKFAICDLVINDNEIIIEHAKNEEIIGGRYGTIFKSAFFGKAPIAPENIISVELITEYIGIKYPTIILNNILEL